MYYDCDERAKELGRYIIQTNATVRQAASVFKISKSTVHKDVSQRLQSIDHPLFLKVKAVLDNNLRERHIRGGIATKKKYEKIRRDRDQ
ncbi:MAG: sporulation transcriptional regulator SpoIIID [Clostridia bacterium]|nr:sporulation transcriptional regulator SpoIIID [Clostridia bacterium]